MPRLHFSMSFKNGGATMLLPHRGGHFTFIIYDVEFPLQKAYYRWRYTHAMITRASTYLIFASGQYHR